MINEKHAMRIFITGLLFYDFADIFLNDRPKFAGMSLRLELDNDNEHDKNAVKVYSANKVVGYVIREQTEKVRETILKYGVARFFLLAVGEDVDCPRLGKPLIRCTLDFKKMIQNKEAAVARARAIKEDEQRMKLWRMEG